MTIDKELAAKYRQRVEKELEGSAIERAVSSYSDEYSNFKNEQVSIAHSFYEKACGFSQGLLKLTIPPADLEKVRQTITLAHLNITPEGAYAFTYFTSLVAVAVFAALAVLLKNWFVVLFGLIVVVALLFYLPTIPRQILNSWRARASDQLVMAVLYIVIYMQHTPNLERAVKFVAEHLQPPLSLDFMKILWDVESKVYSSVIDALDDYALTWKGYDDEFIESVHLIESSLYEPNQNRKKQILDESVKVILDSTQDHMLNFAHNLQSPMEALHMLGVVLPVMGLVMLPMISAFMGSSVKWYYVVLLYNVVLPFAVYAIGKSVLATRPAGSDTSDVYSFAKAKQAAQNTPRNILLSAAVFFLVSSPAFVYFAGMMKLSADQLRHASFSLPAIFASIDIVLAMGLALGLYYYLSVAGIIKIKKKIENMEAEFSSAIFQLGEKLEERKPPELAVSELAETIKTADVAMFFQIIVVNLTQLGAGMREAIFDEKSGALAYYPSATIKSAMSLFVEGIAKGSEVAGSSLLIISEYLRSVSKVTERMKDLLADTVSSMASQVKVFIPIISGIVIGLATLTSTILVNLGEQLKAVSSVGGQPTAVGGGLTDIFQTNDMIPSPIFQLTVGIYVLELAWLLSFLLSRIIYGHDETEKKWLLAQNFLVATVFYVIVTSITVLLFNALAAPVTQLVFT